MKPLSIITVLILLSFTGCSSYSVGWLSHPHSAYQVNKNDAYSDTIDRKVQTGKASGIETNHDRKPISETRVWIWQKEFWTK